MTLRSTAPVEQHLQGKLLATVPRDAKSAFQKPLNRFCCTHPASEILKALLCVVGACSLCIGDPSVRTPNRPPTWKPRAECPSNASADPWEDPKSRCPDSGFKYSHGVDYRNLRWVYLLDSPRGLGLCQRFMWKTPQVHPHKSHRSLHEVSCKCPSV